MNQEAQLSLERTQYASTQQRILKNTVDKQQKLSVLKDTIERLWETLEADQAEINAFLSRVHAANQDPNVLLQVYERESARLSDKLPLTQHITRREYLKYRLECIHKFSSTASRLGNVDSARLVRETAERDTLWKELLKINTQLQSAVPEYERKHGERFSYRGRVVLDMIAEDMPTLRRYMEDDVVPSHGDGGAAASGIGAR